MKMDLSILNKPYYLYREKRDRWFIALFISGFVWFFLFVFGVFDFQCFAAHYSNTLRKRSENRPLSISDLTDTTLLLESEYRNGSLELELRDLLFIQ